MICPDCKGSKALLSFAPPHVFDCFRCDGKGSVPDIQKKWMKEGENLKHSRRERGLVLRQEANRRGILFSVLLKMERGRN